METACGKFLREHLQDAHYGEGKKQDWMADGPVRAMKLRWPQSCPQLRQGAPGLSTFPTDQAQIWAAPRRGVTFRQGSFLQQRAIPREAVHQLHSGEVGVKSPCPGVGGFWWVFSS